MKDEVKESIKSELTDIKGIGKETAKRLLESFGSLDSIKQSTYEDLVKVVGKKKAEVLITYFKN